VEGEDNKDNKNDEDEKGIGTKRKLSYEEN